MGYRRDDLINGYRDDKSGDVRRVASYHERSGARVASRNADAISRESYRCERNCFSLMFFFLPFVINVSHEPSAKATSLTRYLDEIDMVLNAFRK